MGRPGITFEQVAAVADSMVAEGLTPTLDSVRKTLKTGSNNTIHKHLSEWRNGLPQFAEAKFEMPASIHTAFSREIGRFRSEAVADIEARLVIAQQEAAELAELGEALEASQLELLEDLKTVTSDKDMLQGTLQEQVSEMDRLKKENEQSRYAADQAKMAIAETNIKLEMQVEKVSELSKSIELLKSENSAALKSKIEAEKNVAVFTAQLESAHEKSGSSAESVDYTRFWQVAKCMI